MNWIFNTGFLLFILAGLFCGISLFSKKLSDRNKNLLGELAFVTWVISFVIMILSCLPLIF